MAKKKMTPAQAAAARRPDDWEPPKNAGKPAGKARASADLDTLKKQAKEDKGTRGLYIFFIVLFVVMAIVAPFLVINVSQLLGIAG